MQCTCINNVVHNNMYVNNSISLLEMCMWPLYCGHYKCPQL